MRFQADSTSLQGMRLFAVDNTSSPPVSQMNDHNFEFYLPAGAKVEQMEARAPNGQPITVEAVPRRKRTSTPSTSRCVPEKRNSSSSSRSLSGTLKVDPQSALSCRALRSSPAQVDALRRGKRSDRIQIDGRPQQRRHHRPSRAADSSRPALGFSHHRHGDDQ